MTSPARKLTPPPPISHTRAVERLSMPELRARAVRLLDRVPAEVRALRDRADEHRGKPAAVGFGADAATVEQRLAEALDAEARGLEHAAEELAWYAAGCPVPGLGRCVS